MSVLEALESRGISIKGMAVSDAVDIGIVRLILTNPDEATRELRDRGFTTREDWVLCIEISDVPGGLLHGVAGPLAKSNVNLQYFYAYTEHSSNTVIAVIKADDIDRAEKALV